MQPIQLIEINVNALEWTNLSHTLVVVLAKWRWRCMFFCTLKMLKMGVNEVYLYVCRHTLIGHTFVNIIIL